MRVYVYRKRTSAAASLDLRNAIERGNYAAAKSAIAGNRHLMHLPTGRAAECPMHVAAQAGHQRIVRLLLHCGADVNVRNAHRKTPLHLCVLHSKHRCVGTLIDHGADPAAVDGSDLTPMDLAIIMNEKRCLEVLLNYEMPRSVLNSAFYRAALQENTILMNKLLNRGADIENEDEKTGHTALLAVADGNLARATQFLLEKGANTAARDSSWRTCLHLAAQHAHPSRVLTTVLERCASDKGLIESRTRDQETALHLAAERGNEAAAFALVRAGAQVDPVDCRSRTPLLTAVHRRWPAVARCLVYAGAAVNRVPGSGEAPLHAAVAREDPATAQLLLDHGAVVVHPRNDDMDWTIVHTVCESGDADMLERLLAYTDPAVLAALHDNGRPRPPLVVAASAGRCRAVRALLARGVDVNARRGGDGETALHAAARSPDGGPALVDALLDAGARIDARDSVAGRRPLDVAVYTRGRQTSVTALLMHSERLAKAVVRHDVDAVAFLLRCGVSPNVTTEAYGSPLHAAVRHKRYRVMAAILASDRCRPDVRHHGHTALDHALAMGDGRAAKMILQRCIRKGRTRRRRGSLPPASAERPAFARTAGSRRRKSI